MKTWNDPSIIRESRQPAAPKQARRTAEDRARIKDWKAVNKIKGGYSAHRTGNLKATKSQIDYLLGLETRLGYHTERDDHRDLTRLEASDKIATYKHRLDNK